MPGGLAARPMGFGPVYAEQNRVMSRFSMLDTRFSESEDRQNNPISEQQTPNNERAASSD